MFWTDIKRIIRSGYYNFMRSGFTSLASVLVMSIALFVIGGLIILQATLHSSLDSIKNKVDVTVYFVPGTDENAIFQIEANVKKIPEVGDVSYTSSDVALLNFKEKHSNDYLTLQALDELTENPLGASLNIRAKDPSQYESIVRFFEKDVSLTKDSFSVIDKVDYHDNKLVIDRLNAIISGAEGLGFAISLVLVLISLAITFNTIRLIIYMSKEEISVMRLVGAGTKYIRGPFIVSGVLVGLLSSFITILVLWPVCAWLGSNMTDFLGVNILSYYASNLWQLVLILLVSGTLIGGISSFFAVHKYLKK